MREADKYHPLRTPLPALPHCVFVTAGPRAYIDAVSCVARRLEALGSRYPLLTMVEEEDEEYMRAHVYVNSNVQSTIVPWRPFPVNSTHVIGIRGQRTMDKMNLFGLPVRRAVWIDADTYLRENVDELCELPEGVRFAAALNGHSGRPAYVWPSRRAARHCIGQFNVSEDRERYVARSAAELRPSPAVCPYIVQTGIMVISPLEEHVFREHVVAPMRNHSVASYDGTDQGAINTLLYSRKLFGDAFARLHARYNVIARYRGHSQRYWGGMSAAIVHHTGLSGRPWLRNYSSSSEWHQGCARGPPAAAAPPPPPPAMRSTQYHT